MCVENPNDEGSFYCDCDQAFQNKAYAGLFCEHLATSYCTFGQEVSQTSFCTNQGVCIATVSASSAHLGCTCPTAYTGPHCQFVAGTQPQGWPFDGSTTQYGFPSASQGTRSSSGGLSAGVTAAIVLLALGVVGGMAFFIYKKRTAQSIPLSKDIAMGSELALDADGSALKDSVDAVSENGSAGVHSTAEFSAEPEAIGGTAGEII